MIIRGGLFGAHHVGEGFEPIGHKCEHESYGCDRHKGDGSGVEHVAQAYERRHNGGKDIFHYAQYGGSCAGVLTANLHREGVGA